MIVVVENGCVAAEERESVVDVVSIGCTDGVTVGWNVVATVVAGVDIVVCDVAKGGTAVKAYTINTAKDIDHVALVVGRGVVAV